MNNEIQDQISRFLDFEENLEIDNLVYKNLSIWPILRTAVFEEIFREDGKRVCKIMLDKKLHRVINYPQRPFQGWRYLTEEKKPKDIFTDEENKEIPPELLAELDEFGII